VSVTLQQASANALQAWLQSQLSDVTVDTQWPGPDTPAPAKAITILLAGPRFDLHVPERFLSGTFPDSSHVRGVWQIRACEQPLQLDVWANDPITRDDILARLDIVLNAGNSSITGQYNPDPVGDGLILQPLVADDWAATFFDFEFHGPDVTDTPDAVKRSEYRATLRGTSYAMLQVTKTTSRQIAISFKEKLHQTDVAASTDTNDIVTITAAGESHSTGP